MALHLYVGENNLPTDKEFILDNENFFEFSGVTDCAFSRRIIQELEEGTFIDTIFFRDRFGGQLYINCLSTGAKTLFNIYNNQDKIFYGGEMGDNALALLGELNEGNVYFNESRKDDILDITFSSNVYINDVLCTTYEAMEEVLLWNFTLT